MEQQRTVLSRFRSAPALFATAPRWLTLAGGLALIALGLLILTAPLAALWLLAIYAGVSCILSGLGECTRANESAWRLAFGGVWIALGIAIIAWLGFSIAALPVVLAIALIVGGVGEIPNVFRGRVSKQVLSAALALMQIAFGVLALAWPDLTLIVVAVLFGVRTVVFGAVLVWRSVRGVAIGQRAAPDAASAPPTPRQLLRADAMRWIGAALVIALTAASWFVSATLREGLPVIDAFYSAPESIPDRPGELLRADAWPGLAPEGASVQRILYTTTDANDQPAVASAIVVIPDSLPHGPRPVILWDHGTTGIAQGCAPSLMPNMFEIQGIPAVEEAITNGWVIVATDYSGQGAPGNFPYLVGEGEARSTLDSMRAAKALEGLDLSDKAIVWGHSQGGHAALWTGALAEEYAPEIELLGVAAISPAADPKGMAEIITDGSGSALSSLATAWVLIPYSETYADVDFNEHVNPAARSMVREMSARCTSQPGLLVSVLTSLSISSDENLFLGDLTGDQLGERLEQNKTLGPWTMPLLIAWGDSDEVISPTLQEGYIADLCAANVDFSWHEYPGYTHMGIVADDSEFLPVLVAWTKAAFAGEAETSPAC